MRVIREPHNISGFLYENPVANLPALTHCGEALCVSRLQLAPHAHSGFEFIYLSRGCGCWRVGHELVDQQPGDIFVTRPREVHTTGKRPTPASHYLWIGVKLNELGVEGRRLAVLLKKHQCRLIRDCPAAESVLRGLVMQVVASKPHRRQVVLAYLHTFLALIEQRLAAPDSPPERVVPQVPYSYGIQKALSYLHQHLDQRVPLADLAAVATARSVPHFCAQFRREVGQSPAAYHQQLRLHAAREALRQPAFTVTLAAMQFGFSSSQHFSTLFRRAFGVSPRNFLHKLA